MPPILKISKKKAVMASVGYLIALVLTAVVTIVLIFFRNYIDPSIIALLYLLPVGISSAYGGLGPGITAALVAFLAYNYFFIQPYYTLMVHQTPDLLALLVFLVIAVVISNLVGRARDSLVRATAREQDALRLYEFSNELAALHQENEIIQALTDQIIDIFQVDHLEVVIDVAGVHQPAVVNTSQKVTLRTPSHNIHDYSQLKTDLIIPLQTARGLIGEIRLWRKDNPFHPEEVRMLLTFASQGVLAIERARLQQADTRAQILEESDRMKTSLLSSVSHELRTPLATIKAAVTSLSSDTVAWDTTARQELLEAVDEETDHLNQLVENLLNMSRIEAGVLKPKREWNSLEEIISTVVKRFRNPTSQLSHLIEVNPTDNLPLIPVDYLQIEQVFTNLISNSMKYSPEGSTISILTLPGDRESIEVRVINQGPPVPEENLQRIFDKFYRMTSSARVTGTGLGLSICKGIIEAHGGRIWAANLPIGFAFIFTLPLTWQGEQPYLPSESGEIPSA